MFCPKCGTPVPPGGRFCPECGAPLPAAETPVTPPVEEVSPAAPVEEAPAATPAEEVPVTAPPVEEPPAAAPAEEAPVAAPAAEIPMPQTPPPIQTPPPGQTPPPPYPPYSDQTPEAKKASKVPIILLVIGVVALLAVVVFLLVKFLLPGGGGSPQEAVTTALVNMSTAENYQATVEMEMALNAIGQDMDLQMNGDISVLPERSITGFDMDMSASGVSQSMSMYMVQEDGYVTTYTNEYGGGWYSYTDVAEDSDDKPTSAEVTAAARELLAIAGNLSYDGTEKVQGVTANRYSFDIALKDIMDYADQAELDALDEVFSELDIDGEALFSETGDLTVAVLVDPASGNLVGLEMDFAEMLRDLFNNLMREAMDSQGVSGVSIEITVDAASLRMEFFNFGNAQEVAIPPEALNAY